MWCFLVAYWTAFYGALVVMTCFAYSRVICPEPSSDFILPFSYWAPLCCTLWHQATQTSIRTMNISKVLHKNLKLTKDDAVVVLMDIEHAEWEVLPGAWPGPSRLALTLGIPPLQLALAGSTSDGRAARCIASRGAWLPVHHLCCPTTPCAALSPLVLPYGHRASDMGDSIGRMECCCPT